MSKTPAHPAAITILNDLHHIVPVIRYDELRNLYQCPPGFLHPTRPSAVRLSPSFFLVLRACIIDELELIGVKYVDFEILTTGGPYTTPGAAYAPYIGYTRMNSTRQTPFCYLY